MTGLKIECDAPGAKVLVNGSEKGGVNQVVELSPGKYAYKITAAGYESFEGQAEITNGVISLPVTLTALTSVVPAKLPALWFGQQQ